MSDHLADALNILKTHELAGLSTCNLKASKVVGEILRVLAENKYLKSYEMVEDGRGGYYQVVLDGRINDCGVIKPRAPVKRAHWAKKEQQYIPGFGVGLLIVTTPNGIMTNSEADKQHVGGRLLAYVY
ncbi:30S ribosomal protein S8 [Candidatus Micrarchaeota archaeon]|nr:30S ribosomal protein S8 [Candidatus Micrarchaeota archaeon]